MGSAAGATVRDAGSGLARNAVSAIEQRTSSVRDLPVGGLGPLLSRATAVAKEAATEVAEQAVAQPARADAALATPGAAGKALLPPAGDPAGMLAGATDRAETGARAWQSAAADGAPSSSGELTSASQAAGAADLAGRADELLEILEDRLIAELERRGGRFAGVF